MPWSLVIGTTACGNVVVVRPILLAATWDKMSVGAGELDVVWPPQEPAPGAVALPGPELSSMAGVRCTGIGAGAVGMGPWAPGVAVGEGT